MARTTRPPWTRTGCGLVLAICTSSRRSVQLNANIYLGPCQLPCRLHPAYTFTYRLPVVLNFHSQQAVFWNRTAMRVPCSVGNLSSASWFCLPLLFPVSKSKYYNCEKSLWKESQTKTSHLQECVMPVA